MPKPDKQMKLGQKAEKAKQQQTDKDKEAQQAQNNSPVSFRQGQTSWRRQPSG